MENTETSNDEINILEGLYPISDGTEEMNGINYEWKGSACKARGTSTDYSQSRIFFSQTQMPSGMIPGEVYRINCSTYDDNLKFSIIFYEGENIIKEYYYVSDNILYVPENAQGCLIRVWVNKDVHVDGTITAKVIYIGSHESSVHLPDNYYNTYKTEHFENTYNLQSDFDLMMDNDYYLKPTGDDTDMTAAIQSVLNTTGICRLGPGDYYVTGIEIPDYGMLIGSGNSTRLVLKSDASLGYAVKLKNYGSVKDLWILGDVSEFEPNEIVGTRHGILFEGTAKSEEESVTYYRSAVENCTISDFDGGGITCCNTGLSPSANLLVSNCRVFRCGAGINVSYYSEYHRWTNVCVTQCYYGCVCNGGNNNFVNCDFSENTVGLLIDNGSGQSINNTHGTFDACSFNHSGSNEGTAIRIVGASAGEVFTGCQIFYGKIEIEDSTGVRFGTCNFGRRVPISVDRSRVVLFSDCTFYGGDESPLEENENVSLYFKDCFQYDGEIFNPMN